MSPAKAGALAE